MSLALDQNHTRFCRTFLLELEEDGCFVLDATRVQPFILGWGQWYVCLRYYHDQAKAKFLYPDEEGRVFAVHCRDVQSRLHQGEDDLLGLFSLEEAKTGLVRFDTSRFAKLDVQKEARFQLTDNKGEPLKKKGGFKAGQCALAVTLVQTGYGFE